MIGRGEPILEAAGGGEVDAVDDVRPVAVVPPKAGGVGGCWTLSGKPLCKVIAAATVQPPRIAVRPPAAAPALARAERQLHDRRDDHAMRHVEDAVAVVGVRVVAGGRELLVARTPAPSPGSCSCSSAAGLTAA